MTIPTATPSSQGVRAAGLLALLEAFDAHPTIEPHGLIVQRHGHRVLEGYWSPHTAARARLVYSLSKTFTGTALALAVGEGLLGLDDLVVDHLPSEAVARLGQLYLDGGRWDGRQLLPEGWVADASRPHVANPHEPEVDWRQGYGLQLWMSRHGYRGDGAFGQLMVVLPEHDTVVAMFAHAEDMQAELDIVWEHLLPALGDGPIDDAVDEARLAARVATLAQPTAAQRTGGVGAPAPEGRYAPGPPVPLGHTSITAIDVAADEMVLHEGDATVTVPLGGAWAEIADPPIAASAARLPSGAHVVDLALLATPHRLEVTLDPATATFTASWPAFPLFGAGIGPKLTAMRAP